MLTQLLAVGVRVLRQLSRDRRFVALTLVVPLLVITMLSVFFDAAERPFFNPKTFVLPIGAFLIHFLTYVLCAIVLVRERSAQTLARMFVNGYRRGAVIGGYVLAYSVLATAQSLIVLVSMQVLFRLDYPLTTFVEIYGVIWLLALISIALGILISNFAQNEGQIFPFIPLVIFPSIFFSGLLLPVDRLPEAVQWLKITTPMYYADQVMKALTSSDGSISLVWGLMGYGVVVLVLATLTLREQM
jgi:ABC-2 type transport system permease protein